MAELPEPLTRYSRQMILPSIGVDGQKRLAASRVVLVGCGALGCAIADSLVRAGVGTLTIVDRDVVELSNLQRQCLFDEDDARVGRAKVEAAANRLSRVDSSIRILPVAEDLSPSNAKTILPAGRADLIVDGTDNFTTRYLLNDIAVKHRVPLVYGGVIAMRGVAAPIVPDLGPCLRCIAPVPPAIGSTPTCESAGVLGPAVQVVANIQAAMAIDVIVRSNIQPRLVDVDLERLVFSSRDIAELRDPECPCCGLEAFEFLERVREDDAAAMCGRDTVQIPCTGDVKIDLQSLANRLAALGTVQVTTFMMRFVPHEHGGRVVLSVFPNGRTLVRGTDRVDHARTLAARYIGT